MRSCFAPVNSTNAHSTLVTSPVKGLPLFSKLEDGGAEQELEGALGWEVPAPRGRRPAVTYCVNVAAAASGYCNPLHS